MLGESGVGKTSIVDKYFSGSFDQSVASTVGAAYVKATIQLKTQSITLNIWDTAGQERFQSLIPLYMRNARGLIFVVDIKSVGSLQTVEFLFNSLADQLQNDMVFILCVNKIDLVDELSVNYSEYEIWAKKHNMEFMKTSAKTGQGVKELYKQIANMIIEKGETRKDRADTILKDICQEDPPPQKQSSDCC